MEIKMFGYAAFFSVIIVFFIHTILWSRKEWREYVRAIIYLPLVLIFVIILLPPLMNLEYQKDILRRIMNIELKKENSGVLLKPKEYFIQKVTQ